MQNVSDETFDAVSVRKSLSKLSDFQSDTASPYRVLHQAQGDKQEINPIWLKSASKTNGSTQRNDAPLPRKMGLFPVYRLEEGDSLLKEGGVRFWLGRLELALIRPNRKPSTRAKPPAYSRGLLWFLSFQLPPEQLRDAGSPRLVPVSPRHFPSDPRAQVV